MAMSKSGRLGRWAISSCIYGQRPFLPLEQQGKSQAVVFRLAIVALCFTLICIDVHTRLPDFQQVAMGYIISAGSSLSPALDSSWVKVVMSLIAVAQTVNVVGQLPASRRFAGQSRQFLRAMLVQLINPFWVLLQTVFEGIWFIGEVVLGALHGAGKACARSVRAFVWAGPT